MSSSISPDTQSTQFTSFAAFFRTLQARAFEEYVSLLGKEIEDLYRVTKDTVQIEGTEVIPPGLVELSQLEEELQSKHKQDLANRMTDQLTRVSLILKSMWEQGYTEEEITGEAATEMLTRELKQAAETVFKHTPAKFSPCFIVTHRRLVSLSEEPLEGKRYWIWAGQIVPHLVQLETLVWITFALRQLSIHYDGIKAFLTSSGNASYKRKGGRDEPTGY